MRTELLIPYPVSVNKMYTRGKTGGVWKSKRYKAWIKEAGLTLLTQKQSQNRHLGRIVISLFFKKPNEQRHDVDNLIKGTLDLLVRHRIIMDDSLVACISSVWVTEGESGRIIIEDATEGHSHG